MKRTMSLFLAALLMVLSITTAFAMEANQQCSLDVIYKIDETPVSDVTFYLYRVADAVSASEFVWNEDYSGYRIAMNLEDPSEMTSLLSSYIARDDKDFYASAITNSEGIASFTNLEPGMYLVTGDSHSDSSYIHTPTPTLVFFPHMTDNGLSYSTDIEIKHDSKKKPSPDGGGSTVETIDRKALKVWDDEDSSVTRPDSVAVQLLKDGKVYDEVLLNGDNNWRYLWSDLDDSYSWSIVEKETPENYETSTKWEGITCVITNTAVKTDEPQEPVVTPVEPVTPNNPTIPDNPTTPNNPTTTDEPTTPVNEPTVDIGDPNKPTGDNILDGPSVEIPSGTPSEKLPQTGLDWKPVFGFSIAGILCLAIGLIIHKKEKNA